MPRPPSGHVEWFGDDATGRWRTRATNAAGEREWIVLPAELRRADHARAKRVALKVQVNARVAPAPAPTAPGPAGETVEGYGGRWIAERTRAGLSNASMDAALLRKHLYPTLGARPIQSITRANLELFVEQLDDQVRARALAWKTALNVWSLVRKLFDDAASSKRASLRALDASPARDVAAPDRGRKKQKQFLWPSEVLALASCPEVPLAWRRLCVAAVYLGLRAGELAALRIEDLDRVRWVVRVAESVSTRTRRAGAVRKAPKTEAGVRAFAVEPALRPMLAALCGDRREGPLFEPFRTDGPDGASPRLRNYLTRAGVTRPELFATTETRKRMTFHDLRATFCTWCAIRGDDPLKIRARAGHEDYETTLGYVRVAELLDRELVGEVFPALPETLLGPDSSSRLSHHLSHGVGELTKMPGNKANSEMSPAGVEPALAT